MIIHFVDLTLSLNVVVYGGLRVCWAKLMNDMEVQVLSHQSRSGQVRTESCVHAGNAIQCCRAVFHSDLSLLKTHPPVDSTTCGGTYGPASS